MEINSRLFPFSHIPLSITSGRRYRRCGDGKTDAAIYRDGIWWLLGSQSGVQTVQFGLTGDKPIPAAFVP